MDIRQINQVIALVFAVCLCPVTAQIEGIYVRDNLTLRIVVRYPESNLISNFRDINLFIVGNGLGLAWNTPTPLVKTGFDTWAIDLKFSGSTDGYRCIECVNNNLIPVGGRFEYRVVTSQDDMIGANFGLLIHSMSKLEANFPVREIVNYPYFFTRRGSVHATRITSSINSLIGTRNWGYYLPPSFNENSYKKYKTFLMPDLNPVYIEAWRFELENLFVNKATAEETVFLGSEDYDIPDQDGRLSFLTPTPGINFMCKTGDWSDRCAGCVPEELNTGGGRPYMEYMRDVCGYPVVVGGLGEGYLDYMINDALPAVQALANNRLLLSRENLGIGGCSLGGLISCHALWTRQEVFGLGWCKSSSFWWPTDSNANNNFYFLNHTLKESFLGLRAPQKVYIDVTDLEDDPYYAQFGAAIMVVDTMVANSPQFVMDENIWFTLVNGQVHSSYNCLTRTWNSLTQLSQPSGSPKNPNPPTRKLMPTVTNHLDE